MCTHFLKRGIYIYIYIYIQWLTPVPPPCLTFVTTFVTSFGFILVSWPPFLMTFQPLLGPLGSPFRSIWVPWPPFGSLLAPKGEKDEKSDSRGGSLPPKIELKWSQNDQKMKTKST